MARIHLRATVEGSGVEKTFTIIQANVQDPEDFKHEFCAGAFLLYEQVAEGLTKKGLRPDEITGRPWLAP